MRKITLFLCLMIVSSVSLAGEVPNCWNDPNGIDGAYIIGVDTDIVTKAELLEIMDRANGRYITSSSYPAIFPELLLIFVDAVDDGAGDNRLSREELQEEAEKELQPIAKIKGVLIECDEVVSPVP